MNTVIIVQARTSSTRLPNKVLLKISNKTLLEYHVERARKSKLPIIVATSEDSRDDAIIKVGNTLAVSIFRGDLNNVLKRFYLCALKYKVDIIIRTTADCPLVDGELIKDGFIEFKKTSADYLSNTLIRTYPRGFDFEIFTFAALEKAFRSVHNSTDREHVTPYILSHNDAFRIKQHTRLPNKSDYRLTVDTLKDLAVIKILIEKYHADEKNCNEIIDILDAHPEIVNINKSVQQKTV